MAGSWRTYTVRYCFCHCRRVSRKKIRFVYGAEGRKAIVEVCGWALSPCCVLMSRRIALPQQSS